jgi:WD40 repeat protein/transcriptional regulator with XRE-family HTH domain
MSYHRRYKLKDNRFGLLALTLREKAGLVQTEVASTLGVSERTIGHWEGGTAYPTTANLKELIKLYLHNGAFTKGHERDEAKAFWDQAVESASRRKALFDDAWFTALFSNQHASIAHNEQDQDEPTVSHTSSLLQRIDWGEAIDVATFYGREQELLTLHKWVYSERSRIVVLLGMGGIGKTTLSIRFAQEMTQHFGFVFWRSLRNAPPLQELLTDCIHALSEQHYTSSFASIEKSLAVLIELLRKQRCLLVLDNIETLLQAGSLEGRYREGYEDYGKLTLRIAETTHQSCLLLTSREMLGELEPLEGTHSHVRRLKLPGLGRAESQELLSDKELFGEQADWEHLVQHYSGNPLALKIASATVRDLFGGDIAAFVQEGSVLLHTLQNLLSHQFERLTALEQDMLYWLAIEREPISLAELSADLSNATPRREVLSALMSLLRRCLIERGEQQATFTLQPVVMEYVSERLVEQMCTEIIHKRLALLITHAIMKAQSKDYVRDSQVRMLMQPMLERLQAHFEYAQKLEQHLYLLMHLLREKPYATHKYSGGNLINLLRYLKGHLRNADCSSLAIRQAYLQGIDAQDANFTGSEITASLFTEPVESMASMVLSPDGRYLAVGSFSGQIRLWRIADSTSVATFKGHSRMVWALAFSSDSTLLASGGYDGNVKLWKVEEEEQNERCLRTLQGHEKWVRSLAFSPDDTHLITGGDDETVRVWNVEQGTCLKVLRGHTAVVWSVAFSPDGTLLASGGDDETTRVWDMQQGTCLKVLRGHTGMVMTVAFHPAGKLLASGAEDGLINIWDVSSGRCFTTLRLLTSKAASIAFDVEGSILASGSYDGTIEVWRIMGADSPYRIRTLSGHAIWVSKVAFGPHGLLASISYGGKVKLWDAKSGKGIGTLQGYSSVICAVSFSPDGTMLVQGDDQGMIKAWDVSSGRCLKAFQGHAGRIWSIAFSPDGKTFASGGDDKIVKLWEVGRKTEEAHAYCLMTFQGHTTMVWSTAISPDGKMLASAGFERTVKLWQVNKQNSLAILQGHDNFVWSVAFSPDGKILASGNNDGEIRLWEVESGHCLVTLQNGTHPIGTLAFSRDGKTLLSCNDDEAVTQWDLAQEEDERGQGLKILPSLGFANWAKAMTFNHDGTMLATGSDQHTIRIWYLTEKSSVPHLRVLSRRGGQVWSVAFSPDNRLLASGDDDGTLALWDLETGACHQILHSDRPYERMNIHAVRGISEAQRASLKALGAIEETGSS